MKVEYVERNQEEFFENLKVGDVYKTTGYTMMKIPECLCDGDSVNTVCLEDGQVSWEDPERTCERVDAKVVVAE